jgi:secondary thiamine-phosphate synthase enzyme
MGVETYEIVRKTRGDSEVIDITGEVSRRVAGGGIRNGTVTVFVVGSTVGITTTEFEPGLAGHDLARLFERLAPADDFYKHEETWHDDNGHSHCQASLLGPSMTVPLVDGAMTLGTWQQIVLIDFDTRVRERKVIVQVVGE